MTMSEFWNAGWTPALINHLWQSTAIVLIAWSLTLTLRTSPARIRYSVWMVASLKFLIPFALLTSLATQWTRPHAQPRSHSVFYTVIEEFSQPFPPAPSDLSAPVASSHRLDLLRFAPEFLAAIWLCGCIVMFARWIAQWLRAARTAKHALPVGEGREIVALRRLECEAGIRRPTPILFSSRAIEPGIFGVIRPVLLWPERLSVQLSNAQIEAIVAHEIEHILRRDNLTSSFHMLVEALFWFHPAVRWMGSRMNEERERACDEKVIEQSARPEAYAESILKVCAFCIEPASPCVAGVSGSDLKKRILRIMTHRSGVGLNLGRKALLCAAATALVAMPIGFGVVHGQSAASAPLDSTQSTDLPKYDVASVKPSSGNDGRRLMMMTPDGVSMHGVPVQMLLQQAFGVEADRIMGAPAWVKSSAFDIEAKVAPEDAPKLDKLKMEQRRGMLLPLLVERFNLKYHHETRELPEYSLVVAKGGPKLTEAKPAEPLKPDDSPKPDAKFPAGPPRDPLGRRGQMMMNPGRIEAHGGSMTFLAHALSAQLGRTVTDKTGLTGGYDFTLQWTPDNAPMPMAGPEAGPQHSDSASDPVGPSLFTALQEQVGLKLEAGKGPVDVIVIDHIDQPSEN
jgi:uncharacterized protein (TIGR03435 family)